MTLGSRLSHVRAPLLLVLSKPRVKNTLDTFVTEYHADASENKISCRNIRLEPITKLRKADFNHLNLGYLRPHHGISHHSVPNESSKMIHNDIGSFLNIIQITTELVIRILKLSSNLKCGTYRFDFVVLTHSQEIKQYIDISAATYFSRK